MSQQEKSSSAFNPIRWLWLILVVAVLTRVVTAFILGNQVIVLPSIADQISYHSLALRVMDGHGFTFADNWWPATRANEPTAHWSYLYTIYLAAVYSLFGPNPLVARLIQAALGGILMPWLVFRIARAVFSPGIPRQTKMVTIPSQSSTRRRLQRFWSEPDALPLLAAAWVALYGYFIYFGAALMTETFYITSILWTMDCALRINAYQPPRSNLTQTRFRLLLPPPRLWVEMGVAIAITGMLRQVFLPFVPFLILWLAWGIYHQSRSQSASRVSAMRKALPNVLIGCAITGMVTILLIAPITIHNYRQFGSFVLLNTNAGYAFYWSNHPVYGARYVSILGSDQPNYYELLPKEALWMNEAVLDRELMRRGLSFVAADPIRYLNLSLDRIAAYYIFWPLPTSTTFSNITRVASYGLALPFIIVGIFLWGKDVKQKKINPEPGVLLLLFAIVYSLIHLLSWAGIRYRLPVDAVTLLFAARGVVGLINLILFPKSSAVKDQPGV